MSTDWECYQKCQVCGAPLGEPCASMLRVIVGTTPLLTEATAPHTGRKLTAAAAREGGDR